MKTLCKVVGTLVGIRRWWESQFALRNDSCPTVPMLRLAPSSITTLSSRGHLGCCSFSLRKKTCFLHRLGQRWRKMTFKCSSNSSFLEQSDFLKRNTLLILNAGQNLRSFSYCSCLCQVRLLAEAHMRFAFEYRRNIFGRPDVQKAPSTFSRPPLKLNTLHPKQIFVPRRAHLLHCPLFGDANRRMSPKFIESVDCGPKPWMYGAVQPWPLVWKSQAWSNLKSPKHRNSCDSAKWFLVSTSQCKIPSLASEIYAQGYNVWWEW